MSRVALVGLGEVGRIFAEDLRSGTGSEVTAWDTAFQDAASTARRNAGVRRSRRGRIGPVTRSSTASAPRRARPEAGCVLGRLTALPA